MTDYRSEDQIERRAEREMDHLDRLLIEGIIDRDEYDQEVSKLDLWCREMSKRD